jgi:hypothetical protein
MKQEVEVIYINFLYWALLCSTSGSYGDIWAVTQLEKAF